MMQERDFYKELRLRGYHYTGAFRSVLEARGDGLAGKVKWGMDWISFMDCLLQINILAQDSRDLLLPTRIEKMRINAKDHMAQTANLDPENPYFDVHVSPELGTLVAGGIEVFGMSALNVKCRKINYDFLFVFCFHQQVCIRVRWREERHPATQYSKPTSSCHICMRPSYVNLMQFAFAHN